MKRTGTFLLGIGLLLAACQMPETGSLRIATGGRAVLEQGGHGETIRVQLLRNNTIIPIAGKAFAEEGLAGQVITVDGLSVGSGYALQVATGSYNDDGYFEAAFASRSADFEISGGVETSVGLDLKPSPVHILATGAGPHRSTAYDQGGTDKAFLVAGSDLFPLTASGPGTALAGYNVGARKVNSLGRIFDKAGNPLLVVATSDGLGIVGTSTTYVLQGNDIRVADSFAFDDKGVKRAMNLYFGSGITGGMQVLESTAKTAAGWDPVEDLLDIPPKLKESLQGRADGLIRGFSPSARYAYLSTAQSVYRIDTTMFADGGQAQDLADNFTKGGEGSKVAVRVNGRAYAIGPVGASGDGNGGLGLAGTSRGLYTASTDSDGNPVGITDSLALVEGTYGLDIAASRTTTYDNKAYTAAWAQNVGELLVVEDATVRSSIATMAGLPKGTLWLSWWSHDGQLQLLVSGDDGTVAVDVLP